MRMYWTEVRCSPLRWFLPALVAVDLAALFGRNTYWIGVWPQASAAAQIPSLFFGPALAATAAWAAGRAHRRNFAAQLQASALPPWMPDAVLLACTLTYGMAAYGIGVVAAAAASPPEAGPGFLWPGYILLGAGSVVGCTAVGHAVGRWSRSSVMAPICCGIGSFALLGVLGRSLGFFTLSGHPQLEIVPSALAVRLALAATALGIALLVPTAATRGSRTWRPTLPRRLAIAGIGIALTITTYTLLTSGPLRTERAAPTDPLCTTGNPKVCVSPEDRKYLPELEEMAGRLAALPQDAFTLPPTFMEKGLHEGDRGLDGFQIIEGSMWSVSPHMAGEVLNHSTKHYCPPANESAGQRRQRAYNELHTWLEARTNNAGRPADVHGGPPGVNLQKIGKLITQPEEVQFQWARQRLKTVNETPCG